MAVSKILKQTEFFNLIIEQKLSPNQYYILCSMKNTIQPAFVNLHLELRQLKAAGWVKEEDGIHKLESKAIVLIDKIETLFKISKKKTSMQLMKRDYADKIKQYREIFPAGKLPSNKAARVAVSNLENAFRWFFENHEYSWDIILEATIMYVNEYQANNYKFMRTSQYFIRKQEADKTFASELANYCSMVESGDEPDILPSFKQKVV
jgi:hypothetical protein